MRVVSVRRSGTIAALLTIAFMFFSIQIHAQFGFPAVTPLSTPFQRPSGCNRRRCSTC